MFAWLLFVVLLVVGCCLNIVCLVLVCYANILHPDTGLNLTHITGGEADNIKRVSERKRASNNYKSFNRNHYLCDGCFLIASCKNIDCLRWCWWGVGGGWIVEYARLF